MLINVKAIAMTTELPIINSNDGAKSNAKTPIHKTTKLQEITFQSSILATVRLIKNPVIAQKPRIPKEMVSPIAAYLGK